MRFLRFINVTFYDIIHDVIITTNPYLYTAEFVFVGLKINKNQQIRHLKINRIPTQCCRTSKTSNLVWRNNNCLAKAQQLSVLPTPLDIFDIQQHYVHILHVPHNSVDL